jgi:hypothetical protein
MRKIIIAGILGLMLFAGTAFAQVAPDVTYVWTAPTTGSQVVKYVVELNIDGAGWLPAGEAIGESFTFSTFEFLKSYEVRVAGVDAADRQGPYSVSSDPYMPDLGVPGVPSKPVIIQL